MKSGKKFSNRFRNLVIILVVLCYTFIHSMSLRFLIVFGTTQLYQTRRFHAIILPVNIEFSRCIGTYLSAKFELINFLKNYKKMSDLCQYIPIV